MKIILFISMVILPGVTLCQHKPPPPPVRPPTRAEGERLERCVYRNLFSVKQRRNFFPFNKGYSIKLISFNDTTSYFNQLPVHKQMLDLSKVREIKPLSMSGIDSLTDILYNVGYTPVKDGELMIVNPGGKCFNPRNAVLFIDSNNKVVDYINICFECHQIEYGSEKIKHTEFCREKFDLLRNFFLVRGIKIGTVLETWIKSGNCMGEMDSLLNKYVYYMADKRAEPEGGLGALLRVLTKQLRYPKGYEEYEGRVIIAFVVEPDGRVDGKRVIKELGTEKVFSKQLFKIIDNIKWKPAICNGRAVPFITMLPVSVGLSE